MSTCVELPAIPSERWWGDHLRETRWQLELYRLLIAPVFAGWGVPRGDGRPVMLMPGLGGGDQTLLVLAGWLRRIGYAPALCGFVANVDCSDRTIDRLERRLVELHERSGRRVALIGHSRGGHFARTLARRRPDLVSHAISIGAGLRRVFAISEPTLLFARGVRGVVTRTGRGNSPLCLTEGCDCPYTRDFVAPFPQDRVRLTSIYSKGDGVIRWQAAVVPYGNCVEVTGSHVGLIFNRKVYGAVAGALAEPELSDAQRP